MAASTPPSSDEDPFSGRRIRFFVLDGLYRLSFLILLLLTISNCLSYFNKYVHMPTTSTMRLEQKTMADGPGFLLCRQPFFEWIKVKLTDNKTYWDEIDQDVFNDPEGYVSAMQRLYVAPIHSISSPALANETDDVVKPSPDQSEHEDEEEHHHQNIVNQDNSPSFENPGPMKTPDKHGEWSLRFARMQRRTSPCWLYRSQDIRIGTKSAKSLSFNFEDKDDPPDNRTTWHMYLISPTEYDFLDTLATTVSVKSKEQQTMIVKMKQEKYLKRQVQNGGGIDCENYDNFGYMKCVDDCVKTIALKRHRGEYSGRFGTWKQLCRIPGLYDYPELPECKKNVKKLDKLIRKYTELAQMILTNDPEVNETCNCSLPCKRIRYKFHVASACTFCDEKGIQGRNAKITVRFTEPEIETVLQVWSYEAKDLISDLGGSTGIFLGASILSLVAYLKERFDVRSKTVIG